MNFVSKVRFIGLCLVLLYTVMLVAWFYESLTLGVLIPNVYLVLAAMLWVGAVGLMLGREWGRRITLWGSVAALIQLVLEVVLISHRVDFWTILLAVFWLYVIGFCRIEMSRKFFQQGMSLPSWRILIVSQDAQFQHVLVKKFYQYGVFLKVVKSPEAVKALIKKKKFDLIIIEEKLSPLSGQELCIQIKEDGSISDIPVVILGDEDAKERQLTALEAGAVLYSPKSRDLDQLYQEIKTIL
ncbi:MAG: response regulator [Candidatus Omnitrophica bacterium]|nr:response regulator [Candidatus Omnitrophota bacterium]